MPEEMTKEEREKHNAQQKKVAEFVNEPVEVKEPPKTLSGKPSTIKYHEGKE